MNIPSSGHHWIEELSAKHQPKIFLQETEYCNPMYFDEMETDGLYLMVPRTIPPWPAWQLEPGSENQKILQLIAGWPSATENHYIDFARDNEKNCPPNMPKMIFSRGKMQDNIAFVQYWMFSPSSTFPTDNAKRKSVWHEGDWEMMQVAVQLDTANKALTPIGATASQHYRGKTLLWDKVEKSDQHNPVIYIAAGSHATYFSEGNFRAWGFPIIGRYVYRDYTAPAKKEPERYTMQTFEPFSINPAWWLWEGLWGIQFSSPPGPKYTERGGIRIFDNPKGFYDEYNQ